MEAIVIPLSDRTSSSQVSKLDQLCMTSRSLEEIVLGWVRPGFSLVIGLNRELADPCLALSFVRRGETIAIANLSLDYIKKTYPRIAPLKESVLRFADQDGFRPDDVWFDARNERLGIYTDEALDMNVAPAEALLELLLSYSLSSAGFAEISQSRRNAKDASHSPLLRTSLVFLGLEADQGWYELVGFWRTALQDYIDCRAALPN
ncbi:MAG: hypothetical protein J0M12_14310 [Deltaproteobacteria bacterium]|nr:hypothetical protein [Deltaproteobacteria bacterium]